MHKISILYYNYIMVYNCKSHSCRLIDAQLMHTALPDYVYYICVYTIYLVNYVYTRRS